MTTRRIRLALVFGGQSAEHEVSLSSARSVLRALDPARYEVLPIAITPDGQWLVGAAGVSLLGPVDHVVDRRDADDDDGALVIQTEPGTAVRIVRALSPAGRPPGDAGPIDVVFPILHGPRGEDGTLQGLLELAGVPYVGAGVAASAVGMDKIMMKRLFVQAGLPVMPFVGITRAAWRGGAEAVARQVADEVGYPCFVKPANMGSSIGISRVDGPHQLAAAMDGAARFDRRIMVELAAPNPREIECGVLGNEHPEVSVVGEIRVDSSAPFYDYDAKYQPGASELIVPADIPPALAEQAREVARRAFVALDGAGMARVDFFLCDDQVYLNELNTIPGFTPTSMFPLLWAASGVPYARLIDRLVELALDRHEA